MNDPLILLPPLTAAYHENLGPLVTMAYSSALHRTTGRRRVIPWNEGGRKIETATQGNENSLEVQISRCREHYRSMGVWDGEITEIRESSLAFKESLLASLSNMPVDTSFKEVYLCEPCDKERISPPRNGRCNTCGYTVKTVAKEYSQLRWPAPDVRKALGQLRFNSNASRLNRMGQEDYRMKLMRSAVGDNHWNHHNTTFNQCFVATHWPRFVFDTLDPSELSIVTGVTVEHKWLLPAILRLEESQRKRTKLYVHGYVNSHLDEEELDGLDFTVALLASTTCPDDITLAADTYHTPRRVARKIENEIIFLQQQNFNSHETNFITSFEDARRSIVRLMDEGKFGPAYNLLRETVMEFSVSGIPAIRETGISEDDAVRVVQELHELQALL